MSAPSPPFRTVSEELLYNIYLKIQGGTNVGLTQGDINTIGKLNAILQDSELMSAEQITSSLAALRGNVPDAANTLEKLYGIIQGITFLKREDIDTIAELNAIISDADLVRISDLADLLVSLNLKKRSVQFFLEPNFHERNIAVLKGRVTNMSEDFTRLELNGVTYKSRLETSAVWTDHSNLLSLQNWINQFVSGNELDGIKYWIKCIGVYKQGHNGDSMNVLNYHLS